MLIVTYTGSLAIFTMFHDPLYGKKAWLPADNGPVVIFAIAATIVISSSQNVYLNTFRHHLTLK